MSSMKAKSSTSSLCPCSTRTSLPLFEVPEADRVVRRRRGRQGPRLIDHDPVGEMLVIAEQIDRSRVEVEEADRAVISGCDDLPRAGNPGRAGDRPAVMAETAVVMDAVGTVMSWRDPPSGCCPQLRICSLWNRAGMSSWPASLAAAASRAAYSSDRIELTLLFR